WHAYSERRPACFSSVLLPASSVEVVRSLFRPPPRSALFPYTTLFRSHRPGRGRLPRARAARASHPGPGPGQGRPRRGRRRDGDRSEEHTSELQSRENLVCRLLLEKKKREYYDFILDEYIEMVLPDVLI